MAGFSTPRRYGSASQAGERGHTHLGWLDSWHSFSFGNYWDEAHQSFRALRVINDDRVAPGGGFPTHPHRDMEIISIVLEGALEHKDSIGTGSVIRPGDVQRMSAGSGIRHSEFNASETEPVHFLQIWIIPETTGIAPGYEQKSFEPAEKRGRFRLIGSRDGRDGSVTIHGDVALYRTLLGASDAVSHTVQTGRKAWLQVASGAVSLNGTALAAGDGAAIDGAGRLKLMGVTNAGEAADVLLFDLAA